MAWRTTFELLVVFSIVTDALGAAAEDGGNRVGWVPPDNSRSTIGILWSCLSTIFICTWSVLHLEVFTSKRKREKFKFMLLSIVAPEAIAILAFGEGLNVRKIHEDISQHNIPGWTVEHSWLLSMNGWRVGANIPLQSEPLSQVQVRWLISQGLVDQDSLPSKNEILDKSKSNAMVKTIACGQASWLVFQIIGRAVKHLPITTLETTAAAYVACALISYIVWWGKPQDVEQPLKLDCRLLTPEQDKIYRSDILGMPEYDALNTPVWAFVGIVIFPTIFGTIHCLIWNSDVFPSNIERNIWRATSVMTTLLAMFLVQFLMQIYLGKQVQDGTRTVLLWIVGVLYFFTRLYMIAESFVGFRSMPEGVYQDVQWASFIPHI